MKAILIDAENRQVREVEVGDYKTYYPLIKCDTFDMARIDDTNAIFVDDEGLINGTEHCFIYEGRPLAGNGLVLGSDEEGETIPPTLTLDQVRKNVKFVSRFELALMFSGR